MYQQCLSKLDPKPALSHYIEREGRTAIKELNIMFRVMVIATTATKQSQKTVLSDRTTQNDSVLKRLKLAKRGSSPFGSADQVITDDCLNDTTDSHGQRMDVHI